ncbi:MAG: GtrA family protein [Candidatus Peribacteraceae bacterium]|nr:GtrA family protein [Candidatus Peribacteraceae bacterium]
MFTRLPPLWHRHLHHAFQFSRYLMSGGTAALTELLSYRLMLVLGMWYLLATPVSSGIGIVAAFVLHKYFVFKKKESVLKHSVRYAILTTWNILAQIFIVYALVEWTGMDPTLAKVLGIGTTVSWNFFLYKFFVYV